MAAVLFVLVVLAAGGLFFGQKYIVYTDEGLRLDLPFLQQEEPEKPPLQPGDVTVIVEEPEKKPEPEPQPEEPEAPLRAVVLPLEAVEEGTAEELAREQGANAIVLDMKTDQGVLGYVSQRNFASAMGTNSPRPDINEKLRALGDSDLWLVARISCFRDHLAAAAQTYAIETNPGRRWNDTELIRWTSPANEEVRAYLVGVMKELEQLGFDEILLENCGYPTSAQGELNYIKRGPGYQPDNLEGIISSFLEEAAENLEHARLSVSARSGEVTGQERESGLGPQALKKIPGRIWLDTSTQEGTDLLTQAGIHEPETKLVSWVPAWREPSDSNQAQKLTLAD